MPFPASIDPAVLEMLVRQLALLVLTSVAGDMPTARHIATRMLQAHHPETDDELTIAAEIVGLGIQSGEALGKSANPDLPDKASLQLTRQAIALHRASHGSRRALTALRRNQSAQSATPEARPAPTAEPALSDSPNRPSAEQAVELIERARDALQAAGTSQAKISAQDLRKRQMVQRMNENSRKANEKYLAAQAARAA